MKKRLALMLLLAGPAWAGDDDLPQFPKIAPPDPLPETTCTNVANPMAWALGDWVGPNLRLHVDSAAWTLSGLVTKTGSTAQLDNCSLALNADQTPIFAGVRAEDGHMYGALWIDGKKVQRISLHHP